MGAPSVCYVSMLCERDSPEHEVCSLHPDSADDGRWLHARLAELGIAGELELTTLSISNGNALPDPSQFDAIVIGGTFHGVHDARPWQLPLRQWLLEHRRTGRPLLGICGGHQAMAVALGAEVSKRPSGTQVGSVPVAVTPDGAENPLLAGLGSAPLFHFGNSDEVCLGNFPASATVLAATADSPAVAIDYGNGWHSVQFHPEASHEIFQHWVAIFIEIDEFCIKNDEFCIKNDNFNANFQVDSGVIGQPAAGEEFRELVSFALKMRNFVFKLMNFCVKNDE